MSDHGASIEQLRHVVRSYPLIDNHGHNLLLQSHLQSYPLESITTEAQGSALRDAFKSLPHFRAERQLRQLYGCSPDSDWDAILAKRGEWLRDRPEELMRRCLHGTFSILMDDGLDGAEKVHSYDWHDAYTKAPTKRIVRIEKVAEMIMERVLREATEHDLRDSTVLEDAWISFTDSFEREIYGAIADDEVAGFKSVICYRSGLRLPADYGEVLEQIGAPFEQYVTRCIKKRRYRIAKKPFNDYLVLKTLELLSDKIPRNGMSKPLQFHTGLGDNDINLQESNPAYLQDVIEQYPQVPFVLLHSAYPYTREAGYLATVYKHVYLDLGEVFPMVSRDGQMALLRQSLEITPGSKLLFSTDGHWFPETYYLGIRQFREVLEEVLLEYTRRGDITPTQSISLAKDIYFNNSNELYRLHYPLPKETEDSVPKALPWPRSQLSHVYDVSVYERFKKENSSMDFIYVQWLDYMATIRARILPVAEFERLIKEGGRIGISRGNTGTLQNDTVTPAANTTGQIYVEPDLSTLRRTHKKDPLRSATVFACWRDEEGNAIKECPRGGLQLLLNDLASEHGISLLVGFEIEVTFLTRNSPDAEEPYCPLTKTHAWGTLSPEQWHQLPFLAEIVTSLAEIGISIQQFHAEAGQGQYEFILPPLPPLAAIDTLVQARQVIFQIASTHNLRATLHPQPFSGIGTAAHAHISMDPPDSELGFFVSGVLKHVEAICAFSLPEAVSYGRVVDDSWTGGTWVAWGTQNRETPLRRVNRGRWEIRCLDGMANMYLAFAAAVGAGLLGLKAKGVQENLGTDCPYNPSKLSAEDRQKYGIVRRLPRDIHTALEALEKDKELQHVLAEGLVNDFLAMKRVEQKMLADMSEKERRVWLIERY